MMTTRLDFSWFFMLLLVLVLTPVIILAAIRLFQNLSLGRFLATVSVFLMGGVLLVLLSILLPSIVLKSSPGVTAEAVSSGFRTGDVWQQDSNSGMIPIMQTSAHSLSDPFSEAPVVARKPHDREPEIPVPVRVQESKPLEPLPDWVVSGLEHAEQNQANLLESSRLVFESGLFVTLDEAQQDTLAKAGLKLKANLQLRYPQYPLAALEISPEEVRQVASRRSYYKTVEHNFGNVLKNGEPFKQNMYRAYLEIEDSPAVRATLFKKWKQNVGNERTAWLGGGFGLVTLLCLGVAVYLRATHHPATIKSTQ
ncbi:MAG: hypothetical protein ABIK07_17210 [Planctomycetota bacterium]